MGRKIGPLEIPACGYGGHVGMRTHVAVVRGTSPPDKLGRRRMVGLCLAAAEYAKARGWTIDEGAP